MTLNHIIHHFEIICRTIFHQKITSSNYSQHPGSEISQHAFVCVCVCVCVCLCVWERERERERDRKRQKEKERKKERGTGGRYNACVCAYVCFTNGTMQLVQIKCTVIPQKAVADIFSVSYLPGVSVVPIVIMVQSPTIIS